MGRRTGIAAGLAGLAMGLLPLGGCEVLAPSTRPSAADQKQAAILANPGGYDPRADHDLSNGSLGSDIHDILSP